MDAIMGAATDDDLARLTEIHNHYIAGSHVSFDVDLWTLERRREWFGNYAPAGRHRVLVVETPGGVGAAWSSPFRPKAAYDTSVDIQHRVGRMYGRYWDTELLERRFT